MNLTIDHAPGELAQKAAAAVRRLLALAAADGPVDAAAVVEATRASGCGHDDEFKKAARSTDAGVRARSAADMGSEIQTKVGRALYAAGLAEGERARRAMLQRLNAAVEGFNVG